ncbi:bifunctional nuclease family protein [Corynebacterium sp. CNCTC7651]|uniref:bifunctional nuclease family protein n=1 Tax=Corynebacterium sp. CNCTC7651 TaxID=2815361 RepID=UPI001F3ACBFB|nr:bifunctional nuclease family protein [Corynebacterium sp. CNCTC7651]UIZ93120.1 bifunctional nuclease family protein [Corynebacterium sp. CNCTC7651]
MVPVNLLGVFPFGPEQFLCALLEWEEKGRYVPLWLPPIEGATLAARLDDWSPKRPDAHEAMADIIAQTTPGIASIELSSYHDGMFTATLTLEGGAEIDMRPSDALLLALVADVQLEADETVLQQASMALTKHDAREFFGLDIPDATLTEGDLAAGPRPEAVTGEREPELDPDAFEDFMRELGFDGKLDDEP